MPKRVTDSNAPAFGRRLVALLADAGQQRRGAGAYLAKNYRVSTVTANAWLNGEYKPNTATAKRIANDHGASFDELYFGGSPTSAVRPALSDPIHEVRVALALTAQALAGAIPPAGTELLKKLKARKELRGTEFVETLIDTLQAELGPQPNPRAQRRAARATDAGKRL